MWFKNVELVDLVNALESQSEWWHNHLSYVPHNTSKWMLLHGSFFRVVPSMKTWFHMFFRVVPTLFSYHSFCRWVEGLDSVTFYEKLLLERQWLWAGFLEVWWRSRKFAGNEVRSATSTTCVRRSFYLHWKWLHFYFWQILHSGTILPFTSVFILWYGTNYY